MIYLDTGVIVRGLLVGHDQHETCDALITQNAVSSCHALAESFNTLTGHFKLPSDIASELLLDLTHDMGFEGISQADYLSVIRMARKRGVQGGIVYDAIHAEVARRLKVEKIFTYNVSNFRHVAPEVEIVSP